MAVKQLEQIEDHAKFLTKFEFLYDTYIELEDKRQELEEKSDVELDDKHEGNEVYIGSSSSKRSQFSPLAISGSFGKRSQANSISLTGSLSSKKSQSKGSLNKEMQVTPVNLSRARRSLMENLYAERNTSTREEICNKLTEVGSEILKLLAQNSIYQYNLSIISGKHIKFIIGAERFGLEELEFNLFERYTRDYADYIEFVELRAELSDKMRKTKKEENSLEKLFAEYKQTKQDTIDGKIPPYLYIEIEEKQEEQPNSGCCTIL